MRKTGLLKIKSGKKYLKQVDPIVLDLEKKQDKQKLEEIKNRFETIKLKSLTNEPKALVNYILANINLSLYNLLKIKGTG
jgi:hypothetical protein